MACTITFNNTLEVRSMAPRLQLKLKQAEERKKRQEKFRKRSKSLFSKIKLLAKDTDAWAALIATHPSGKHDFLEKENIFGCWKVVGDNESASSLEDVVDDGEEQASGIGRCYATINADTPGDEASAQAVTIPEEPSPDATWELDDIDVINSGRDEGGPPASDSYSEIEDALLVLEESYDLDTMLENFAPDLKNEVVEIERGVAEPHQSKSEIGLVDVDIPCAKGAEPGVFQVKRAEHMTKDRADVGTHLPKSDLDTAIEIHTKRPDVMRPNRQQIDLKKLLQGWDWVFQK
ncbi:hypothetical protein B0O99DRAFT_678194 [Bisporella sp. PMI_857]|nr:hypothetical protein B0O99DRAFT_678194 [Bisporella sp. PMI_857]